MKKILISDPVDTSCASILKSSGYEVDTRTGLSGEELSKIIKDYNGLVVRSETKVTAEIISLMENMEVIGRAGTGVDNIDIPAATKRGILVMNTPGGNTISTAEHTMALILSMFRNIPQANHSLLKGKWARKDYKGTELYGKVIGIIGLGKIGREVALRCQAFGMKVNGFDPVLSAEIANRMNINLVDLDTLFSSADLISVHVPLNDETRHLINSDTLSKCREGVKIVNCARGGIVNEQDIVEALESGKVSSAAFDVYETEPPDFAGKLLNHPNVVCTPHLGASTEEAQVKVAVQIAEQFVKLFEKGILTGAVNSGAVLSGSKSDVKAYAALCETMGAMAAQLVKGQLKEVNIEYRGDLLNDSASLMSTAVMKGLLSKMLTETINFINAPYFFKELGISVVESKTGADSNYKNLVSAVFITDKEKKKLSGTVFGNNEIRIVNIDEFQMELKPEGNMLLYSNIDRPGVLAAVGKILAESNINIAGLSLGRTGIGQQALTIINLDSGLNTGILSALSKINGIENVYPVII